MAFNEFSFFVFFCIFCFGLYLLNRLSSNNNILKWYVIMACIGYVSYVNWKFALCAIGVAVFTHLVARFIEKSLGRRRKLLLVVAVFVLIGQLAVFKYCNFFMDALCSALGTQFQVLNIILPLGISFYTFSALSYVIDVYGEKYEANKSLTDVLLYTLFFPKLVCGPIVRANDFFRQRINLLKSNMLVGMQIFVWGFFKKTVLADHLGIFVNDVFRVPQVFDGFTVVLAMVSYSLQIYFDFSGYSDMAIGASRMLGYEFDYNFCLPYVSKNPTEFWKRWHISLSSWLQEYVYYPLGGNRCKRVKNYINLLLTMLIGGLWHGANWTFVVWGGLHGIGLIVHKIFILKFRDKFRGILWNSISIICCFVFVTALWTIFRAETLDNAVLMFKSISNSTGIFQPFTWTFVAMFFALVERYICGYVGSKGILDYKYSVQDLGTFKGLTIFMVFVGLTIITMYVGDTAFIYGAF